MASRYILKINSLKFHLSIFISKEQWAPASGKSILVYNYFIA